MAAILQFLLELDKQIFFYFQSIQCPFLDYVLGFPTLLGDTFFLLTVTAVLILFLDRKHNAEKITLTAFAILSSHWVIAFLKDLFGRPRPYDFWHHVVLTFGKASNPAFAAAHVLNRLHQGKAPWLYTIAAWVGITRIYTGVHYPTDVVAGAMVGIASSSLLYMFVRRFIVLSPAAE
jgi:membrane-associated phospholipid phosphatase